jgi:hypothetical protein
MRALKIVVAVVVLLAGVATVIAYHRGAELPKKPHSVTITWDPVPKATSYKIYRRTDGAFTLIGESKTNKYVDQFVPAGTYYYGVSTVEGDRESEISVQIKAEVPKD